LRFFFGNARSLTLTKNFNGRMTHNTNTHCTERSCERPAYSDKQTGAGGATNCTSDKTRTSTGEFVPDTN